MTAIVLPVRHTDAIIKESTSVRRNDVDLMIW